MLFCEILILVRSTAALLLLPMFLFGMDCFILRLPCQTDAYFTNNKPGFYLFNALLSYLPAATYDECIGACIGHAMCKSINTRQNASGCELNSIHHGMIGANLSAHENWTYVSTDYKAKKVWKIYVFRILHIPSGASRKAIMIVFHITWNDCTHF